MFHKDKKGDRKDKRLLSLTLSMSLLLSALFAPVNAQESIEYPDEDFSYMIEEDTEESVDKAKDKEPQKDTEIQDVQDGLFEELQDDAETESDGIIINNIEETELESLEETEPETVTEKDSPDKDTQIEQVLAPSTEVQQETELEWYGEENGIWANDSLYLTGRMPKEAVVTAVPVEVEIDGEYVLAAYDIKIYAGKEAYEKGIVWQPDGDDIHLHFKGGSFGDNDINVYHMEDENAEATLIDTVSPDSEGVEVSATSFSIYALAATEITVEATDESTYKISVTYSASSDIPADAVLEVSEITDGSDNYDGYRKQAEETLGYAPWDTASFIRMFDIKIMHDGKEVQPAEGSLVSVDIQLDDGNPGETAKVVHFAEEPEVIEPEVRENTLSFETASFSVYAIMDDPVSLPEESGWHKITSLEELSERASEGLLVGHMKGYYLTDDVMVIKDTRTGIVKTAKTNDPKNAVGAVRYYFEQVPGQENTYTMYCFGSDGRKKYVKQSTNSLLFTDAADATQFEISKFTANGAEFRIRGEDTYCVNMQGGDNGKTFAAFNNLTDTNAKLNIWYYNQMEKDPFGLDGKTYSIAFLNGDISAYGVRSAAYTYGNTDRLRAVPMSIRPDIIDQTGMLTTSGDDSDLGDWTFSSIDENRYYITTTIDGALKYLALTANGIEYLDEPDPNTAVFTLAPGSGNHSGKYNLQAGGKVLSFSGSQAGGFTTQNAVSENSWLNFVKKNEDLSENDFVHYTAHKVNISDVEAVPDGQQVIMYTSVWNPEELKYEYYIVDYNGSLVKCYESGNTIAWVGSQSNTALWNFTEYHDDNGRPNYYYELQNEYSGQYLVPRFEDGQILSDEPAGINMNGRRYGDDFSTIISWDDKYYSYAGITVENGALASGPLSEAQGIYFAILDENEPDVLTTVNTVNNNDYGIRMRMVDYNNPIVEQRDSGQSEVLGINSNNAGSLEAHFDGDYPNTVSSVTGKPQVSLSTLFADAGTREVNNLFIKSIYEENGYFEYDSTQNFASLQDDGNFKVYNQIGSFLGDNGPTRTHGQFMPYNDIEEGSFTGTKNLTDVHGNPLSDLNPRKYEKLYNVADPDYFFGMEMEAGFTQTESGLDNWGHDIIFEFSGDDDFWLYVDGDLVLDIGGVHSASSGKINFRTGNVETVVRNAKGEIVPGRTENTTLRAIFERNYRSTHPDATNEEVNAYLDGIFVLNDNGQYVFSNYSTHTMKMFYMERGAGASNLHMRFNLSSVRQGTVVLTKNVTGTDRPDFLRAEFPYQIHYHTVSEPDTDHILPLVVYNGYSVKYKGRSTPVKYAQTYTPSGTDRTYNSVFFLRSGESAEIEFPPDATEYCITECCINSNIYDSVYVNDNEIEGTELEGGRLDYSTGWKPVEEHGKTSYVNHVRDTALRTLTFKKKLLNAEGTELTSEDDSQKFDFRLSLGGEGDEQVSLTDMQEYYVKNKDGEYCSWSSTAGAFESTGVTNFSQLSQAQKEAATFVTSPTGAISQIPTGYTVEIRDLIVGTKFKVEERDNEIPEGYALIGYDRVDASYIIEDGDTYNVGIIRDNADPAIVVKNRQGWGLSAEKEWSDSAFTSTHGDIYLGVCVNGELIQDTVRKLENGTTSAYWFFEELAPGKTFADYEVRELVPENGGYTPVDENGSVQVEAVSTGTDTPQTFTYEVSYEKGEVRGGSNNVRTDTVTNARDGIKIVKTDMNGDPVPGAVFTLNNENGDPVAKASYKSNSHGTVTTAYLGDGTYTLTETQPPKGYEGIASPIEITVSGEEVSVSSEVPAEMYSLTGSDGKYTLKIKNKAYTVNLKKENDSGEPLGGAHFAVYKQIQTSGGAYRRDYRPLTGYEDFVSDAETGAVGVELEKLNPGTYYISETRAPRGYEQSEEDFMFTISPTGAVSFQGSNGRVITEEEGGVTSYTIAISNTLATSKIRFKKVDLNRPFSSALSGAVFDMFRIVDGEPEDTPMYTGLTSDVGGYLLFSNSNVVSLLPGEYLFVETTSPVGYVLKRKDAVVTVTDTDVTYDEGTVLSSEGTGISYNEESGVYTILLSNRRVSHIVPTLADTGGRAALLMILVCAACVLVMFIRGRRTKCQR